MDNLKMGDFLFRVEGDETAIATLREYYKKEDFYALQVIYSNGSSNALGVYGWEIEAEGWRLLDGSMSRSQ
jgi:hypothetical protein